MLLHGGLHHQMFVGGQLLGIDEGVGQRRVVALQFAEQAVRVIRHVFFFARAVGL